MADSNWSVRIGTRVTDDIQKQLDTMPKKTVTVKAVLDNTGLKTIGTTELTKYEDVLGNVVVANKKFDASGKELTNTIKSVKSTVDTTSQTLQTASKHTKTLGQDFIDTAGKVAKFGAITAIFGLVTTAIGEAVKSVKELDASLTELKKVSDLSGSGLEDYTEQAFKMATELASTASDVTDAVTEFAKSSYTLEESQVLARQAIIFQTIADGAISASDSATVLIQTLKAYNMTVEDSVHVINSINEVSNNYATSSTDLSSSIGKVASTASMAGVEFENLLGLLTASNEIVQNAGKVANGYKAILTNLMTKDLEKQFNQFGLTTRDINDELKDGYTIITELATVYNSLGQTWDEDTESMVSLNDEMNKLLQDIAGKHNINTLVSGLSNIDVAISATESAINSAGSAAEEYATAMDSIAKKSDAVKGAFQELVWGDGGLSSFIKSILDGTTGILKFANDTDLLKVALVDLGVVLAITIVPNMMKLGSTILATATTALPTAITMWKAYIATQTLGASTMALAGTEAVTLNMALSASIPIIGLVVAGISALVLGINGYNSAQEKAKAQALESLKTFESQNNALLQSIDSIQNEKTSKERLISIISSLNEAYDAEKGKLKDINGLRQDAIDLLYDEAKANAQKTIRETGSEYKEANEYLSKNVELVGGLITGSPEDVYKTAGELLDKYNKEIQSGAKIDQHRVGAMAGLEREYEALGKKITENKSIVESYNNAVDVLNMTLEQWLNSTQELSEAQEEKGDALTDYEKSLKDLDATLSVLSGTTISGLADAFSLLKDAQEEINDTGKLSIENYESLMNLGAEYQAILFDENGQLRLNEESVTAVYNAKIDEMAITSARNMVDLAGQLSDEGKSFADLANSTNSASVAGWEQIAVMMAELELSEQDSKALQVRINGIKQWAEQAKKNVGTYSKTTKAISTQTKAIDEQKEALDKLKDEYKAVTKYIEDQLDSEISRIEDAKSAELDRIDSTIDALKKKRDAEEDYWDNRISALEAQNDATEKQIELEKLQENLALARNKKVMVMGANGWEVREDEQAVAQAEQDIADYTRKQQAQTEIDILNKLKETALDNYDSQIQAQEEFKAKQESVFDAQIQILEGYKTEYNNMINAYEKDQNRLIALQVLGTDFENQTWQARLSNLQSYVNRYNTLQASLSGSVANTSSESAKTVKKTPSVPTTEKTTPTISSGIASAGISFKKTTPTINRKGVGGVGRGATVGSVGGGAGSVKKSSKSVVSSTALSHKARGYASGVASVPSSGMAITGDDPKYSELLVGNKLNGTFTQLERGDRVVNSVDTRNLLGGLLSLGSSMGLNGQTMGMNTTNQSNATSQSIQIANITLPSVTNGQGLLDELRGFASGMLQTSYSNA